MYLQIDGNYGEGGGQILRTTLSLSCILTKPVQIVNIRKGRRVPGLQPQHLTSVNACRRISSANTEGASLQSTYLQFSPGETKGGDFHFDVAEKKRSAGSTSLVLQTLLLPLSRCDRASNITVLGGTHVPWSPPFHYLREIFAPTIERMGCQMNLGIRKWGWYPLGGGEVSATIQGQGTGEGQQATRGTIGGLDLVERGSLLRVRGLSASSNLPKHIRTRQERSALQALRSNGVNARIDVIDAPSKGQGTVVFLWGEFENSVAGFTSLGERGKPAERVAQEAAAEMVDFCHSDAALEQHLADQLVLPMALAGDRSQFRTTTVTQHFLTNAWVVNQFFPGCVRLEGEEGQPGLCRIDPV